MQPTNTHTKWLAMALTAGCLVTTNHAVANTCKDSKNAAQVARTAYNKKTSDKKKYLPSGYTYVKSWSSSKHSGGDHAYLSTTGSGSQKVCHYAFRGLDISAFKVLKELKKMHQSQTCQTASGKSMGSCSKAPYVRYLSLRNGILADIKSRKSSCRGGIRLIGHSMGGAIASILAAELYMQDSRAYGKSSGYLRVYTFGSPRVFKKSAANNWHKRIWAARWVYQGMGKYNDHVPSYPSSKSGFSHYGQAYRVKKTLKFFKYKYSYGTRSQNWEPGSTTLTDHIAEVYTKNMNKLKCK